MHETLSWSIGIITSWDLVEKGLSTAQTPNMHK